MLSEASPVGVVPAHIAASESQSNVIAIDYSRVPLLDLPSATPASNVIPATTIRRRGPSLSRRTGQSGNVFQHCNPWNPAAPAYGRYWIDVPREKRKRRTVPLGLCTTRSAARRKLRVHIEKEGINAKESFTTTTAPAMTFRDQANKWIGSLPTRRRKPVKPATIFSWQNALDKWILPNIGDEQIAEVSNGVLRELVDKMATAGLSAKTIVNYSRVVKTVVASAVNAEGDKIHPRTWNDEFCGIPIVDPTTQHRPTVTEKELAEILATTKRRYAVLFALLAGTGLRIGEALGLKPTDLSPDCRVLYVRRSIWHGREQQPKTANAVREIDIPEPLAELLRGSLVGKSGYLFAAASGRPLIQRNVLRVLHAVNEGIGFHSFRRFRTETLRRKGVPEDLIKLWLGHSKKTLTDYYAGGLTKDLAWRQEWSERVGVGFSLVGLLGLQNVGQIDSAKAA